MKQIGTREHWLEPEQWIRKTGTGALDQEDWGALDEVDWNWSTGSGRLELEHWMKQTGTGALDEVDWNRSTG